MASLSELAKGGVPGECHLQSYSPANKRSEVKCAHTPTPSLADALGEAECAHTSPCSAHQPEHGGGGGGQRSTGKRGGGQISQQLSMYGSWGGR